MGALVWRVGALGLIELLRHREVPPDTQVALLQLVPRANWTEIARHARLSVALAQQLGQDPASGIAMVSNPTRPRPCPDSL
mgnify:CR=1 FL=1